MDKLNLPPKDQLPEGTRKYYKIKPLNAKLTAMQKKWLELYKAGLDATKAARAAGYAKGSAKIQGSRNKYELQLFIDDPNNDEDIVYGDIAESRELQKFWTEIIRDKSMSMKDRMRAAELLMKSQGGFFESKATELRDAFEVVIKDA